jgi:hypothetical protein
MAKTSGQRVQVYEGRDLRCLMCGGDRFNYRDIKMVTSGTAFFGGEWLNKSGEGAICVQCGFVHTFMRRLGWYPNR